MQPICRYTVYRLFLCTLWANRFGRVLNVCLPEVTGTGAGMSVADLLAAVPEGTEELDVALLERHRCV